MKFISPERLYWIAALAVPAAALVYAVIRRRRELGRLFSGPVPRRAVRLSRGARRVRLALVFFAMICAALAAARPYWSTRRTTVVGRGRDVAVVFDVSKSMLARDLAPSRLEHAKYLLRTLVRKLPGDRLALIAFAGNAYTACPLTADPAVFEEYVDELSVDAVQLGGTNLEEALREALRSLDGTPGTQAVAVLTDGDELTGDSARAVAELKKRGIPLIVIGLGDPARPAELPDAEGNIRRGGDGKVITSALGEEKLKKIAAATGGAYIRSTVTDTGADAAAARIAELAPAEYGETEKEIPEERSGLFVWLAFAALAAAILLPERPLRRTAALLALCALSATGAAAELPDGGIAGARTAAELYNLGLERHESGDAEGAGRCFEAVLRHPDRDERVRAKALFNLGAMEHDGGRTIVAGARDLVRKQELDPALEKLAAAEGRFAAARELYFRALSGSGAAAAEGAAADDLRLYEKDLAELEKLKKAIEELKKQQQKARQSAQDARERNREQQQQQQQQQQQNGAQQQQQQQQQQQNGEQQQQQQSGAQQRQGGEPQKPQGGDEARSAARRAAEESSKLRDQAKSLGQSGLEERARRAAEELRAAENSADSREAREHLDRAVEELGGDEKKAGGEKPGGDEKQAGGEKPGGENKDAENRPGEAGKAGEKSAGELPDGGARLLDVLDGEERESRRRLRRGAPRPPVGRDW